MSSVKGGVSRFRTNSEEETLRLGMEIGHRASKGDTILLYGDLGAGKTTLTKGIVSAVAKVSPNEVVSPTFVYLQIYEGQLPLFHFDLYRLTSSEEFYAMGFSEYLEAQGVTCIEWPERVPELAECSSLKVKISHEGENVRLVEVSS